MKTRPSTETEGEMHEVQSARKCTWNQRSQCELHHRSGSHHEQCGTWKPEHSDTCSRAHHERCATRKPENSDCVLGETICAQQVKQEARDNTNPYLEVLLQTDGAGVNCTTLNAPITSSVPRGSLKTAAVVLGEVHLGKASEKEPPESQYEPFNSPQERQPRRANEKPQKASAITSQEG